MTMQKESEEKEEWYFSIVDVVRVLTEQQTSCGQAHIGQS